jgi:hypothetical protein
MEEENSRLKEESRVASAELELRNNSKTSDVTSNIKSATPRGNSSSHILSFNHF